MAHHLFNLFIRDEGSVHAADASASGHIEHVALSEQLLGAHFAQNGAAVDLRSDLERDTGWKIRLDGRRQGYRRRGAAPSISLPATIIRSAISSTMITI